jgi:hypothetical protein
MNQELKNKLSDIALLLVVIQSFVAIIDLFFQLGLATRFTPDGTPMALPTAFIVILLCFAIWIKK